MELHLNMMAQRALNVAQEREHLGQIKSDTMSILKHCAGEVVEATEAYAKYIFEGPPFEPNYKTYLADELADVITCALIAAANMNIDIEEALLRVEAKNLGRIK